MLNFLKKDTGNIFLLTIFFALMIPFFYLHQGLLLIDTGREFYIPSQMLTGSVLYKNIYNIYGPLSYQINALLFMIFGQSIKVLYLAGLVCSYIITITTYLLSREFLNKILSILLAVLIISSLVFGTFLYNSVITYSYAIIYALCAFMLSLLFLIKYIKNENSQNAIYACFFAGISFANKYEFLIYIVLLPVILAAIKPLNAKTSIKAVLAFLIVPILSFGSLVLQGFNLNDLKETNILFKNLINAPLLKIFFSNFGAFPSIKGLISLIHANGIYSIFGILPITNIILASLKIKEIYKDKALFTLVLCTIAACAKNLFYLNVNHMGIFLFPICILTFIMLLQKYKFKFSILILVCSILLFISEDFSSLKYKNFELKTQKGTIYTYKKDGLPIQTAYDFIIENTNADDKITVMPEGSFINFATGRNGDNFYYNLSPLFYTDVFGEKRILTHFKNNLPEYFIILPIDNSEYGSRYFGIDYAQNFYEMIVNNYDLIKTQNEVKIFKRKNIK